MAMTFANFPDAADSTGPQTNTLEDGTEYIVQDIGTTANPLPVWRLRALEPVLEVLSRADVILSPQSSDQTVMNGSPGIMYIVYDVTMLAASRGDQVITRSLETTVEQFWIGRDVSMGSYLTHTY